MHLLRQTAVAVALCASVSLGLAYQSGSGSTSEKKQETWWSLRPLERPAVPKVPAESGVSRATRAVSSNPIDTFLVAKLSKEHLGFSPAASRRTLISRVYFDLIGLPPT